MNDQLEGSARDFGGRVQSAVGGMAGDARTQAQGAYNQAAGQAQKAMGQMGEMVKEQPVAATLVALVVGYLIGRLTA